MNFKLISIIVLYPFALNANAVEYICEETDFKNIVHEETKQISTPPRKKSSYMIELSAQQLNLSEIATNGNKPYKQKYVIIASNDDDIVSVFSPKDKRVFPILESFSIGIKDMLASKVTVNPFGASVSLLKCKLH